LAQGGYVKGKAKNQNAALKLPALDWTSKWCDT